MSRVIVIASGKGGAGKTTIAANLGVALGDAECRTVLVDLDFGLRNVDGLLGMDALVLNHLGDYFSGGMPLEEVLTREERYPSLELLLAPRNALPGDIKEDMLSRLVEELKKRFEIILLDAPAGVGPVFSRAIQLADEGVAVTQALNSSVRNTDKVLHLMEEAGVENRFVLINRLRERLLKNRQMMSPEDIREVLGVDLLGVIPEDEAAIICGNTGKALVREKCPAGRALGRIARRVRGTALPIPPLNGRRGGLFRA